MERSEGICLLVVDGYPEGNYSFIEEELAGSVLSVRTQKRENGIMAGIEWALPTVIVAYLLKPFFEAFLQEAGKDAYAKAKAGIKKLVEKNLPVKTTAIAANTSPEKLSKNYDQSRTISIKAALHGNLTFTVLFNESIENEEFDAMLEGLFGTLEMMYRKIQAEHPETEAGGVSKNELYIIADMETRSWTILTREQMGQRYRD